MKTVSKDLHALIKSLNKQEKRYFKLHASRHVTGKKNNYVRLFDAIDKQTVYDEGRVKKKFEGEKFIKQLHVTKNYLYNLILNSLRLFNEASSEDKFPILIRNVQLLIDKGLFEQSKKILQKAKKTAIENEQFLNLLEVFHWEHRIIHASKDSKQLQEYMSVKFQEELDALDNYKNYLQFQLLHDQVFHRYWQKGSLRKKEDKQALANFFDKALYRKVENAKSYNAKMFYLNARFSYHYLAGELDKSYQHIQEQVALYENLDKSHKVGKRVKRYIGSLNNLFIVQKQLGKHQQALKTIHKLRNINTKSIHSKANIVISSYNLEIDLYHSLGQFSEGIQNLNQIKKDFQQYIDYVDFQQRLGLYYNLSYLYFGANEFEQALDWMNILLNDKGLKHREDIHSFAQILNLIIHYELGNDDLLEYIVQSTYRFLSKGKRLFKVESIILQFLKKYPNWISNKEMLNGFQELYDELILLLGDEFEKRAFEYFDFISWLKSKIEKESFETVVKKKEGN